MLIKPLKYRFAMVHKLLFHPFMYPDLMESLKKRKYSLQKTLPITPGPRTYIDGYIAAKNECLIETNNERKLLAVEGTDNEKITQIMEDLVAMSQKDFGINLDTDLDYMELTANFIVTTDKNPLDTFSKFRSGSFDKFSELLGSDATQFGIRLVPNNLSPSSRYWYDVQVQPRLIKSDKEYYVSIIYRSEEKGKVMNFSQKINDTVSSIIAFIEES